jgi:hypothetical protein
MLIKKSTETRVLYSKKTVNSHNGDLQLQVENHDCNGISFAPRPILTTTKENFGIVLCFLF